MPNGLSISLRGIPQITASLRGIKDAMQRRMLRIALQRAGTVLRRAAASRVVRESGLLARSIGLKVATTKGLNPKVYAVVGARRGVGRVKKADGSLLSVGESAKILASYRKQVRQSVKDATTAAGRKLSRSEKSAAIKSVAKPDVHYATRYAHLVEFGTKRTRAKPFLRPALASATPQITATIIQSLREQLERQAAKRGS